MSGSRDVNLELAVGTQTGRVQLVTYPDVEALATSSGLRSAAGGLVAVGEGHGRGSRASMPVVDDSDDASAKPACSTDQCRLVRVHVVRGACCLSGCILGVKCPNA